MQVSPQCGTLATQTFKIMKKDIHPAYYSNAKVTCACGNTFTVGSTKNKLEIEICFKCHPFYTGKEKLIDSAGRIEKFQKKIARSTGLKPSKKPRKKSQKRPEKIV